MSSWNVQSPYTIDKPVFGSTDIDANVSVSIAATDVGLNSEGVKLSPSGVFLAKVGSTDRFLPRDYLTTASATNSPNLVVSHPELFKVGDVIRSFNVSQTITFANTWTAVDVFSLRIGNLVSENIAAGATSAATVATNIRAALVGSSFASAAMIDAIGDDAAGVLTIYTTGNPGTIATTENSSNGTATVGAATFTETYTVLGTVSSINYATKTLVLAANAAAALPIGCIVGTNYSKVYGLYPYSVDWTYTKRKDLAAVHGCDLVYRAGMVYWDRPLKEMFPDLNVQ